MNRKRILLLGTAREASTRCADKMMRSFAGTTLFHVYAEHMRRLNNVGIFSSWGMAVAKCDERLWSAADDAPVPVIERDAQSVSSQIQPRGRELHFLDKYDEEYVLWYNGCLPFFPLKWIRVAIENFLGDDKARSVAPVVEHNNWFWWPNGLAINNRDPECLSTQGAPRVFASVHAFFIYDRKRMLAENLRWAGRPNDPQFLRIPNIGDALLDVDTEEDFRRCEEKWDAVADKENVP